MVANDNKDQADHLRVDKVADADKVVLVEDSADQEAPVVDQEDPEVQVAQVENVPVVQTWTPPSWPLASVAQVENVPVVQTSKFFRNYFCSMLMLKAEVRKHSGVS